MRYAIVSFALIEDLGPEPALFLCQLVSLMSRWRQRTGREWYGETYADFHKLFPWWSVKQIRRIVAILERERLLESRKNAMNMKAYRVDLDVLTVRLRRKEIDPVVFYAKLGQQVPAGAGNKLQ